jgi:hypothetical protein
VAPTVKSTVTSIQMHVTASLAGGNPLEGIQVAACPSVSFACVPSTAVVTTGPDGTATVGWPLRTGSPYLLLRDSKSPPAVDDMARVNYPDTVYDPQYRNVPLYNRGIMDALFAALGPTYDLTKSHVHLNFTSCGRASAQGVVVSSPDTPSAVPFYGDSTGLPVAGQKETTASGTAGFVNLTAGQRVTIEARVKATNQLIARFPLPVLDMAMTIAFVEPASESEAK